MINIFFALITLAAICVDLIVDRNLLEEVREEIKEHGDKLEKAFEGMKWQDKEKEDEVKRAIRDETVGSLRNLEGKAKKNCANDKAWFFYGIIVILSIGIIVGTYLNWVKGIFENQMSYKIFTMVYTEKTLFLKIYDALNTVGLWLWLFALVCCVYRLCRIIQFRFNVKNARNVVGSRFEKYLARARIMSGDTKAIFVDDF